MALLNQQRELFPSEQVRRRSTPRDTTTLRSTVIVRSKRLVCLNILTLVYLLSGIGLGAASGRATSREYQIKSLFLYNFVQFTEWPTNSFSSRNSPVDIGVLGDDPFGRSLDDTVKNETMNGREITVQRYRRVDDIKECHVLFISRSESRRLGEILARLEGRNILTVGETDAFTESGGMIGFVIEQRNKIRFKINTEAAGRVNLKFSSKLLRLAINTGKD